MRPIRNASANERPWQIFHSKGTTHRQTDPRILRLLDWLGPQRRVNKNDKHGVFVQVYFVPYKKCETRNIYNTSVLLSYQYWLYYLAKCVLWVLFCFRVSSLGCIILESLQFGLYYLLEHGLNCLLHIKLRSVLSWQPMVGPLRCSGSRGPEGRLSINQNTATGLQEMQVNVEYLFLLQLWNI